MNMFNDQKNKTFLSGDERGSITAFVLVVFSAMFLVAGTAIDLARHEQLRTSLQYNLDRAVLATASLKQTEEPEVIVNDYMDTVETLDDFTLTVDSDVGLSSRSVSASATTDLNTWFLRMAGINTMPITASSAASEEIPNLEISLVLDVSGSMSGDKLANLKVAAKDFVTTMLAGVEDDTSAISIIPFNQGVAPSTEMYDALSVNETHTYSTCLDFADSDFDSVAIDPAVNQTQAVYTSYEGNSFQGLDDWYRTCYTDDYFEILPYSDTILTLHNKIDGLVANGMTSGHLGIKWGLGLLDPSFQSVVTEMSTNGTIDAGFDGLPVAYDEADTLKVMIMMGDGSNTYEYRMDTNYDSGASDLYEVNYTTQVFDYAYKKNKVWKTSTNQSKCSNSRWVCVYTSEDHTDHYLYKSSSNNYLDIESDNWISASAFTNLPVALDGWSSTIQLEWPSAWGLMTPLYYGNQTGNWTPDTNLGSSSGHTRYGSESDTVMAAACTAARDAGIVVYTIGFETSSSTSEKLEDCATTSGHYYDAEGTQISTVFGAIAANIQKLKLTQ